MKILTILGGAVISHVILYPGHSVAVTPVVGAKQVTVEDSHPAESGWSVTFNQAGVPTFSAPDARYIGTRQPTPNQFVNLFTIIEEVGIEASTNNYVQAFLRRVRATGLTMVDLDDPATAAGMGLLVQLSLITSERATEILAGLRPA